MQQKQKEKTKQKDKGRQKREASQFHGRNPFEKLYFLCNDSQKKSPSQTVVADDSGKVIDCGDQRTRCNGGVDTDSVENQGDRRSRKAGDHHGKTHGTAAGDNDGKRIY